MMATLSGIAPIVPSGGSWVAPTRLIGAKSTRSGWEFQSVAVRANASDVDGAPDQSQRLRLHLFVGKLAQEVEIAPLVSLQHMIEVEGAVAAPVLRTGRPERRGASLQFAIRNPQFQPTALGVELDQVAVLNQGKRASHGRLR